jgi:hypothetical protein
MMKQENKQEVYNLFHHSNNGIMLVISGPPPILATGPLHVQFGWLSPLSLCVGPWHPLGLERTLQVAELDDDEHRST